ncbi:hypothetical protein N0V95_008616, partial [Ascochyta clinopodiicola]
TELARLIDLKATYKSSVENYAKMIRTANTDAEKKLIPKYQKKLCEKQHRLQVAELRVDARGLELKKKDKEAADLRDKANEEERVWEEQHPKIVTAPIANGPSQRQAGPQVVVRSPTMPSVVSTVQTKKSSTSTASSQSRGR